ncbi:hypothetical protein [Microbispora sp. NBRC 16548]|uniref:hypothetical protein n=1 Tax=Microbispora sp. NBRC 16548 TaxID=3030994 RepID=UPI0024A1BACE|nr:hypothetical protein [Microbispora sp. NBRC 16548]GLX06783.1 hypothetical protein Misp03_37100 [Microbispora sp. NBRC 16548]
MDTPHLAKLLMKHGSAPERYASATLDSLRPEQDPGGVVTGWPATDVPVLVLVGRTHVGKTYAGCALINGYAPADPESDWGARYFRCLDLVNPDGSVRDAGDLSTARTAGLLFLDGLGTLLLDAGLRSPITPDLPSPVLYELIDARLGERKPTVVATNLAVGDAVPYPGVPTFEQVYGKIADRLLYRATVAHLIGPEVLAE